MLKNIAAGVNKRLNSRSINRECFEVEKKPFQDAIQSAGYNFELSWKEPPVIEDSVSTSNVGFNAMEPQKSKRKRKRNIIWFNPPYSSFIENKIGKSFRDLIDKHFKKGTLLGKLFNKNRLKISFCCLPNLELRIMFHNKILLSKINNVDKTCNCQRSRLFPVNVKCLVKDCIVLVLYLTDDVHPIFIQFLSNKLRSYVLLI